MGYLIIASGIYLAGISFAMNTQDLKSAVVLRVIPGLIGFGLMIAGANTLGLI